MSIYPSLISLLTQSSFLAMILGLKIRVLIEIKLNCVTRVAKLKPLSKQTNFYSSFIPQMMWPPNSNIVSSKTPVARDSLTFCWALFPYCPLIASSFLFCNEQIFWSENRVTMLSFGIDFTDDDDEFEES